jgi:hypothetical protein
MAYRYLFFQQKGLKNAYFLNLTVCQNLGIMNKLNIYNNCSILGGSRENTSIFKSLNHKDTKKLINKNN